jgi:hypothetical protein
MAQAGGLVRYPWSLCLAMLAVALAPAARGEPSATIRLSRSGDAVSGLLLRADGTPLANVAVALTAIDAGARLGPQPRHLFGSVPGGAVSAAIALRAGIEGSCICAGPTGASIGGIRYKEQGRPELEFSALSLPIEGAPPGVRTLELMPGKSILENLRPFPVRPGALYALDTSIAAPAAASGAGYIAILFMDAAGRELRRDSIPFAPAQLALGTVQTDVRGLFRLALPEALSLAGVELRAEYAGIAARPVAAVLVSPLGPRAALPQLEPTDAANAAPLAILFPLPDFNKVFADAAADTPGRRQWDQAAHRVGMLYFSGGALLAMPDLVLARMVRDLERRHIGLGVQILALNSFHEPPCGQGVEGYADPNYANAVVAKLLKAGAAVDQFGMDEPLWFGHFYKGPKACRSAIPDLAGRVAVMVRIYRAAFPKAIVGDTEPFPAISQQPGWHADYAAWVRQFETASATPLRFLLLDFDWGDTSLNSGARHDLADPIAIAGLAKLAATAASDNGQQLGMILDGGGPPPASSDAQWMQQARIRIRALLASGVHFDQTRVQSWNNYPQRTLPLTDPDALGSLLLLDAQQ